MTQLSPSQPIGIFDSGIGGLTVARALVELLPQENIIYFGDTAHLPYGDKSPAAIQAYSVKIVHMLLQKNCKLILIACNTATSAAIDLIKEYIASKALLVDVINPMVNYLHKNYSGKTLGLIGTKQTVSSNVYQKKIDALNAGITLHAHATPLLVPFIEEDLQNQKVLDSLLEEYLSQEKFQDIEALILGCTHYPIIKQSIAAYYQDKVALIDSSEIVAHAVKTSLAEKNLLNPGGDNTGSKHFYVSDYTTSFSSSTKLFFHGEINLEHYPLWE